MRSLTSLAKVCCMVVLEVAVLVPLSAQAAYLASDDALVPAGLVDGNVFHLAFVTSGVQQAKDRGGVLSAYDTLVQGYADGASSLVKDAGLTWKVIGSVNAVTAGNYGLSADVAQEDARDHALVSGAVYLLNGTKIADDNADMWDGSLDANPNIDETGATPGNTNVFTGTQANGTVSAGAVTWGPGEGLGPQDDRVRVGVFDQSNYLWLDYNSVNGDNAYHFYALSEKITVGVDPIPEPGTMGLLMLGLVGLLCRRGTHRS